MHCSAEISAPPFVTFLCIINALYKLCPKVLQTTRYQGLRHFLSDCDPDLILHHTCNSHINWVCADLKKGLQNFCHVPFTWKAIIKTAHRPSYVQMQTRTELFVKVCNVSISDLNMNMGLYECFTSELFMKVTHKRWILWPSWGAHCVKLLKFVIVTCKLFCCLCVQVTIVWDH